MKEFSIITDGNSDLTREMVLEGNIDMVPMEYAIDGTWYSYAPGVDENVDLHDFYQGMRDGKKPTTTQINATIYEHYFEPHLKAGKDILYICFSSGLSGTFHISKMAAEKLSEKYPERQILCVDSCAAALGQGMLVHIAAQQRNEGKSLNEVAESLVKNRDHMCHWFTVDDLYHLKRGGRISAVEAIAGTALGIKPILHINEEGKLIPIAKVRGRKKAMQYLIKKTIETCPDPKNQTLAIIHGDCPDEAKILKSMVKEELKFKKIITSCLGPVVGSHTGPGILALIHIGIHK